MVNSSMHYKIISQEIGASDFTITKNNFGLGRGGFADELAYEVDGNLFITEDGTFEYEQIDLIGYKFTKTDDKTVFFFLQDLTADGSKPSCN